LRTTLFLDNDNESLLKLVLSAFGEIEWRVTEVCPFLLYVFLKFGKPLNVALRLGNLLTAWLECNHSVDSVEELLIHVDGKFLSSHKYYPFCEIERYHILVCAPTFIRYRLISETRPETSAWWSECSRTYSEDYDTDLQNNLVNDDDEKIENKYDYVNDDIIDYDKVIEEEYDPDWPTFPWEYSKYAKSDDESENNDDGLNKE
jgi:hypothetical protein